MVRYVVAGNMLCKGIIINRKKLLKLLGMAGFIQAIWDILDKKGYLHITGRKKDILFCPTVKILIRLNLRNLYYLNLKILKNVEFL
jgi:hypothetical protein